jgi:hypothetical protein
MAWRGPERSPLADSFRHSLAAVAAETDEIVLADEDHFTVVDDGAIVTPMWKS